MTELEKRKTVLFKSDDATKLLYLIRQGLHVEPWLYLANSYIVKLKKDVGVWCIYKQEELKVEIQKEIRVIPEDKTFWDIASELLSIGMPEGINRFENLSLSPDELVNLETICIEKGYKLKQHLTYTDIEN